MSPPPSSSAYGSDADGPSIGPGPGPGPARAGTPGARRRAGASGGAANSAAGAGAGAGLIKEPPHDLNLERAVLGVLLAGTQASAVLVARDRVTHPLGFYHVTHQIVYQACLDLADEGAGVDAAAVAELLGRTHHRVVIERLAHLARLQDADQLDQLGQRALRNLYKRRMEDATEHYDESALERIGGYPALAELGGAFAPASALERNAELVWDLHLKRRLISKLGRLGEKAYRTTDLFNPLVDEAARIVLDLGRLGSSNRIVGMADAVANTLQDLDKPKEQDPVLTGFPDLDKRLMSLRPGGLYILAARPGVGKTSLALNIVHHVAAHHLKPKQVLFFGLEVDHRDLVKKLLSCVADVDFRALETGELSPDDRNNLTAVATELKEIQLDMMDVSDLSVHGLRSVAKRQHMETGGELRLIVIDYLQLLSATRADMNEYEKINEISRTLKILARELGLPIIALSQMSRESERGGAKPREPRLSDLRGSGSIEQDADAVIFLHQTDESAEGAESAEGGRENAADPELTPRSRAQGHGSAEVRAIKAIIAKNRFGPVGHCLMSFHPARQKFQQAVLGRHLASLGEQQAHSERMLSEPSDDEDPTRPF